MLRGGASVSLWMVVNKTVIKKFVGHQIEPAFAEWVAAHDAPDRQRSP